MATANPTFSLAGSNVPAEMIPNVINAISGKSALAKLGYRMPVPVNGAERMILTSVGDVNLVGESQAIPANAAEYHNATVFPVKGFIQQRFSREILEYDADQQLNLLEGFINANAASGAIGLDLTGFHGFNPATRTVSTLTGDYYADKVIPNTNVITVTYSDSDSKSTIGLKVEAAIDDAIDKLLENGFMATGMAASYSALAGLRAIKTSSGERMYKDLGGNVQDGVFNGIPAVWNWTVDAGTNDAVIIGDFAKYAAYNFDRVMPISLLDSGDPDNTGRDLAGHDEVLLRTQVRYGVAFLVPSAFVTVKLVKTGNANDDNNTTDNDNAENNG